MSHKMGSEKMMMMMMNIIPLLVGITFFILVMTSNLLETLGNLGVGSKNISLILDHIFTF